MGNLETKKVDTNTDVKKTNISKELLLQKEHPNDKIYNNVISIVASYLKKFPQKVVANNKLPGQWSTMIIKTTKEKYELAFLDTASGNTYEIRYISPDGVKYVIRSEDNGEKSPPEKSITIKENGKVIDSHIVGSSDGYHNRIDKIGIPAIIDLNNHLKKIVNK